MALQCFIHTFNFLHQTKQDSLGYPLFQRKMMCKGDQFLYTYMSEVCKIFLLLYQYSDCLLVGISILHLDTMHCPHSPAHVISVWWEGIILNLCFQSTSSKGKICTDWLSIQALPLHYLCHIIWLYLLWYNLHFSTNLKPAYKHKCDEWETWLKPWGHHTTWAIQIQNKYPSLYIECQLLLFCHYTC
jgi:hypothetical protein